jgi:hypothetical protein
MVGLVVRLKHPNSRHQAPENVQAPTSQNWMFEAWGFSECWFLDFGCFQIPLRKICALIFPKRAAIAHMRLQFPSKNAVFTLWYVNCKGPVEQ